MRKTIAAMAGLAALVVAVPLYAQDAAPKDGADAPPPPPAAGPMRDGPMKMGKGMMARLDTDQNGTISEDEFANMGAGDMASADADGNGEITFDEFKAAMEKKREERMKAAFERRFDIDGDGKVTVSELRDRQDKRFALLDRNNDGQLSRDEFRRGAREMMGKRGGPDGGRDHGKRHGWWSR